MKPDPKSLDNFREYFENELVALTGMNRKYANPTKTDLIVSKSKADEILSALLQTVEASWPPKNLPITDVFGEGSLERKLHKAEHEGFMQGLQRGLEVIRQVLK